MPITRRDAITALLGTTLAQAQTASLATKVFDPDTRRVLRNPCVGWALYCEGWEFEETVREQHPSVTPANFWKQMDSVNAADYATHIYIRILWSALESEEGKYAWKHNPEYIQFIEEARSRGLKLSFRVYHATKSRAEEGVPKYVFDAGAKYKWDSGRRFGQDYKIRDVHSDDPVFLAKFDKFVEAFAEEYDDPEVTDFVDSFGAGWWGEGHHITLSDEANLEMLIDKLTGIYYRHLKNTLTVYNLAHKHPDPTIVSDFELARELVYEQRGFLPRRDGLGSQWFSEGDREMMREYFFPKSPLIGEGCYWLNNPVGETRPWYRADGRFKMNTWPEALTRGLDDALDYHANTFDLRVPLEAKMWIEQMPDQVQRFITHGGYRLYPAHVNYPKQAPAGGQFMVLHAWKNLGVGVLPNNHPNWNQKYKVAFALLDPDTKRVLSQTVVEDADPGAWVKGTSYQHQTKMDAGAAPAGTALLAVSLYDTKLQRPGLELSVSEKPHEGWYPVGPIEIA